MSRAEVRSKDFTRILLQLSNIQSKIEDDFENHVVSSSHPKWLKNENEPRGFASSQVLNVPPKIQV